MNIILRTCLWMLIFSYGLAVDVKDKPGIETTRPGCPVKPIPGPCADECQSDDDCRDINSICCNSGCSRDDGQGGVYNMCLVRDECTMGYCKNNVGCQHVDEQLGDYMCICRPGYTDKNCSTNIDDCESEPCENDGVCHDLVDGYNCCCTHGWTGKNCTQVDTCQASGKTLGQELPKQEARVPCSNKCGLDTDIYCVVEVRYKRLVNGEVVDVSDECSPKSP